MGSADQGGAQAYYDESCSAKMAITYSYNSVGSKGKQIVKFNTWFAEDAQQQITHMQHTHLSPPDYHHSEWQMHEQFYRHECFCSTSGWNDCFGVAG